MRGVKRVCRGVYCQQGTIMIRVNSRSLRKIREVEKMNFPAGFFNRPATKVRRNNIFLKRNPSLYVHAIIGMVGERNKKSVKSSQYILRQN